MMFSVETATELHDQLVDDAFVKAWYKEMERGFEDQYVPILSASLAVGQARFAACMMLAQALRPPEGPDGIPPEWYFEAAGSIYNARSYLWHRDIFDTIREMSLPPGSTFGEGPPPTAAVRVVLLPREDREARC